MVKRLSYDAFWNVLEDTDVGFSVPFGFVGGLHDWETGMVRFGYRDYDPDLGTICHFPEKKEESQNG